MMINRSVYCRCSKIPWQLDKLHVAGWLATADIIVDFPPTYKGMARLSSLVWSKASPRTGPGWSLRTVVVMLSTLDSSFSLLDSVFLRLLDEPVELGQWLCSIPSVTALRFYSWVACCEMVMVEACWTSMNSDLCFGQYCAAWVMTVKLSPVTQWHWARYSHLTLSPSSAV